LVDGGTLSLQIISAATKVYFPWLAVFNFEQKKLQRPLQISPERSSFHFTSTTVKSPTLLTVPLFDVSSKTLRCRALSHSGLRSLMSCGLMP